MSCPRCKCPDCQHKVALRARLRAGKAVLAVELRAQGITLPRIAEMIGSSQAQVCKLIKEAQQ